MHKSPFQNKPSTPLFLIKWNYKILMSYMHHKKKPVYCRLWNCYQFNLKWNLNSLRKFTYITILKRVTTYVLYSFMTLNKCLYKTTSGTSGKNTWFALLKVERYIHISDNIALDQNMLLSKEYIKYKNIYQKENKPQKLFPTYQFDICNKSYTGYNW